MLLPLGFDFGDDLADAVGNIFELAAMLAGTPYGALYLGNHREALEFAERAIPIVREHGTPLQWTRLCGNVGLAALITGDTDRATDAFREQPARTPVAWALNQPSG